MDIDDHAGKVYRKVIYIIACFSFSFFILIFNTNIADATIYSPGQTLEPDCAPGSPNCGVLTPNASASVTGLLSSTDWNTFNNKLSVTLNAGKIFIGDGSNQASAINIFGDASLANSGLLTISDNSITASKILDGSVEYAKLQNIGGSKLLGNSSSTSGLAEEISIGYGMKFNGADLMINSPTCSTNERLSWDGSSFVCKAGAAFIVSSPNTFLAGPSSGGSATSSYRSIVAADIGIGTSTAQEVLLGNQSWYRILDGSGKILSSVLPSSVTGSLKFVGTWNANTNTPTLGSGGVGGVAGDFYIVEVAGNSSIDGNSTWNVGDWIINDGSIWDRIEQGNTVASVNGSTGNVILNTDNVNEGTVNKYFSNNLARNAISGSGAITYSTSTGDISCPTCLVNSGNGNIVVGTGMDIVGSLTGRLIGSGNVTFGLNNTGVTAGQYGDSTSVTNFTVNAQGRITAVSTSTLNASAITSGSLSVARGGTGTSTFTTNGLLYGDGTNALSATIAGTSGQFLVANGSGVPVFVSASGDMAIASSGLVTINDGSVNSNKITDNTIVNGDISASAGIAYSKLNLANSIVNADIVSGTISNSKLANSSVGLSLGSSGSDISLSSSSVALGDVLTINVPNASASARGVVSTSSQIFVGLKTFNQGINVIGSTTISGGFITPRGSDYVVTGTQNDVDFGSGSYFHYAGNGAATLTGIAGGVDGRLIRILNDSSYQLTIKNQSADSLPENRVETPGGEDISLDPDMMLAIIYDSESNNWHLASQPTTASTISSFAYIQGGNSFTSPAILGTNSAYPLNFITSGNSRLTIATSSATFTGNGATTLTTNNSLTLLSASGYNLNINSGTTGALIIDSGSTGNINIGTSTNAKTINIGNNTGATAVNVNSGSGGINLNGDITITDGHTFTTGSGLTTINSTSVNLAGNSSVIDMSGSGILGINTTTNRPINTGTGMFTTGGSLTVTGNKLYMGNNSAGSLLIADGTNFNPVSMSGDATIASNGALTLNYASAQSADSTHKGFLTYTDWNTFNNKQNAIGYTAENISNKSADTSLSSSSDVLYPTQKAVKTYVDNRSTGLNWQQPVEIVNVIADTDTPVISPSNNDVYIVNTNGNTGVWSSFHVGDIIQYQTDQWVLIKSATIGDRFGVAYKSTTTPYGGMTGKKNYKAQITGGTSGAFTYTFTFPDNNDALFVKNVNAFYHNSSFVYSSSLSEWVQLSATVDWRMGSGIQANGNTASLGNLTENWDQAGAFDINTNGNININNNKSLLVTGSTTMNGNVVYPKGSDYTITGVQNDVNLGNGSLFDYTGNGSATFTGIAGGIDGRFIRVINSSNSILTLSNQNTNSIASNRMIIETGNDTNILPNSSFELSYDSGVSRWRVVVLPANTAIINDGNAYGSDIDIGSTDAYGLNFITNNTNRFSIASNASTLTGNGATTFTTNNSLTLSSASGYNLNINSGTTGALILDSGSTGNINIGTSTNAKTINIGNNTGATAVNVNSGSGGINLGGSTTISGSNTFTTGSGLTTINSTSVNLAGNSTVIDMSGTGILGINTTTNRPINTGTGMFTVGGNLTVSGTSTVDGSMIVHGNYISPKGTDYVTTGVQNDINLGIGSYFRYTGSQDATFTGIAGGTDGRYIMMANASTKNLTLKNESASSTAANRIVIETGSDVVIAPNASFQLQYDSGASRWRVIVLPTNAVSVSTFAYIQGGNAFNTTAMLGTTDAYSLNLMTSGSSRFNIATSSATLSGIGATTITTNNSLTLSSASGSDLNVNSGTTGTLNIDSGTTGSINIGTNSNAKTITIGNGTGLSSLVFNAGTGNIDIGANAVARNINIGTGAGVVETIGIGGTGANIIAIGNTQTGGSVNIGSAMTSGTLSFGGIGLQTGQIDIGPGIGAQTITLGNNNGTKNIDIGNGVSGNNISIGNGVNTSAQIVDIANGNSASNSTVNILAGVATAGIQTLNLGTGASAKTINIGNQTGATAVTIDSGTGAISIGAGAQARTLNIGTGAAVQTVTLGSTNGASTLTLESGTGAMNIGTGAFAKTITMGNSTGATALALNSGTGGIALLTGTTGTVSIKSGTTGSVTIDSGTTGTVNIGNGSNAKTINIGTGTAGNIVNIANDNTTADTINVGSALDTLSLAASTTILNNIPVAASGNFSVCINSTTRIIRLGASATSCNPSSIRFKHGVADLEMGLSTINDLRPVNYYYNDTNTFHNGLIAEEVYKVIPTAVVLDDNNQPYALDYNEIIPVIVNSIKEISLLSGDISPEPNASSTNGLSTLISQIQSEVSRDPILIIGRKIIENKRFLTDLVSARITAIRGYIDELFTRKIHSEQICLKKTDGTEICVDGDQMQSIIDNRNSPSNISSNINNTVISNNISNIITNNTQTTPTSTIEIIGQINNTSTTTQDTVTIPVIESNEVMKPVTNPEATDHGDEVTNIIQQ